MPFLQTPLEAIRIRRDKPDALIAHLPLVGPMLPIGFQVTLDQAAGDGGTVGKVLIDGRNIDLGPARQFVHFQPVIAPLTYHQIGLIEDLFKALSASGLLG